MTDTNHLYGNNIVLNVNSKRTDCSYFIFYKFILEALSSKINFIIYNLLKIIQNPDLYNKIKSVELSQLLHELIKNNLINFNNYNENSLLDIWEILSNKILSGHFHNGIIDLIFKYDFIYIENDIEIEKYKKEFNNQDDKNYIFCYYSSTISVEFPLYKIINETKDLLLGIELEKKFLEILKIIYQYIFKNIDDTNAYNLFNKTFKNRKKTDNEGNNFLIVEKNIKSPTIELVKTFNLLASHIDSILDDISLIDEKLFEDKKFNLNLSEDEINELEFWNNNIPKHYLGSGYDLKKELELTPKIEFEELNKQLNNEAKVINNKTFNHFKTQKKQSFNYKNIFSTPTVSILENNILLKETNILDSTNESFEKHIPDKERERHSYILAGSGSGKTSLIETSIHKDCKKTNDSIIIFDLMGKATRSVQKFVNESNRLVIIDPHLHKAITPIINPFELKNKDELSIENRTKAIINAFDIALNLKDGWSINMKAVLAPCISTLLRKGDSDIYELQRFMNDEINQDLIKLGKKSPIRGHKKFFEQEFHNESYDITKRAISAKLQVFLNDPTFANLVTGKSTIDLEKEINTKGKIIIFKLTSKQNLFARLMMEMIQDIMRQRINIPDKEIVPTHIYLDEFQNYLTTTIEEILSESRNYKFYVTFAHQSFVQLSKKMQGIVLSNSNIKIVGKCSYDDGKKMSREIKANFEQIENLEQGEFLFRVGSRETIKLKNTDKFINDKTPYHNKLRTKHMKYQFKKYYVYKDLDLLDKEDIKLQTLTPKYQEF